MDCVRGFNSWMCQRSESQFSTGCVQSPTADQCWSQSKHQLAGVPDGKEASNVHPALSNGCPPLCSLMVISNMRNIQRQRGKVAQCTALPSASTGVGATENWHFKGQAENPGKHTLLLAFSFVCHKNIPQPRDHSSFWLLNICYESLVIQLCMFFLMKSAHYCLKKNPEKYSSTHPGLLRQEFLN